MFSFRFRSQARRSAWLFIFVLLAQAWISGLAAAQSTENQSKWTGARTEAQQPSPPPLEGQPDPAILPAWERFRRQALGELKVYWQYAVGTPEAIYGFMADVSAKASDPEAAARAFLAQEAGLLRIQSVADLHLIKRSESIGGHHVFFQQTYRGLPVYHGRIEVPGMIGVHINRAGRVHALVNSSVPGIALASIQPRVTADVVYDRMLAELGTDARRVQLRREVRRSLVVYVTANGTARLAWQITIPAREPLGTWQAFWDARTGQRLSPLRDTNYYVNGTGRVFITNAVVATGIDTLTDQNDSAAAVPAHAYSTVTLFNLDGSGFLNGPYVNTSITSPRVQRTNHDFTDLDRSTGGFSEVEVYWAIDDAQRYIQSFGITSACNYSIPADAHGTSADNSFYSPNGNGTGEVEFGTGGVDDAEDAEIVWHEYGHAMLDNQVTNMNQNFDGMGEGWSDYWGATMPARHPSANHAKYDPAVGEWDAVSYNPGSPPYLRRVDTDARYPDDRSPSPHVTGMIWSGACWDIHQALGQLVADEIFIEGNFLMPFAPTLPQGATAMLQADTNINGGANNAVMLNIYIARGLASGPSITVNSPNGGETWLIGSTRTIQWTGTGFSGDVKIELSRDGGSTYETLFTSTANDGSENWAVTGPETAQARIKVSSVSSPTTSDTSNGNFTITSTSVTVIAPNGGEIWTVGSTQTISWSTTGSISNVKIELSRNGPGGPFETLFVSTANDGSQPWTVTGPGTILAVVRISNFDNPLVADVSNGNFEIVDAPPPPPPPPGGCSAKTVVEGQENADETLATLYRFRDEVLSQTSRGRAFIQQYYQVSPEMVRIMLLNPSLLLTTQSKLERHLFVVRGLVERGVVTVTQADINDVDRLVESFAMKADPSVRPIFEQWRRNLRDPQVLNEFGVRVRP
ncbi:MAG: M36 family metallopeptidase [Acidobacteriota bacterium]|nr:M36 family metallopeptidase [Blastocatellia bacterium]MDW8238628.1 M36 family metallopeptidase [Acidobacteriota bacterium]